MAMNGISTPERKTHPQLRSMGRRRRFFLPSLAIRILLALLISWIIIMAFFVTGVASH